MYASYIPLGSIDKCQFWTGVHVSETGPPNRYFPTFSWRSHRGVIVEVLDSWIVVNEFEF